MIMKCQNCGYESKNLLYCPVCGEKIIEEETKKEEEDLFEKIEKKEVAQEAGMQYKVFAIIGYVLGIISIAFCWVPFMIFYSVPGIIFSKVGDKPTNKQQFAKKGYKLSVTATIINVIVTIACIAVAITLTALGIIEAVD